MKMNNTFNNIFTGFVLKFCEDFYVIDLDHLELCLPTLLFE